MFMNTTNKKNSINMKKFLLFLSSIILYLSVVAQTETPVYDSVLARKLGADEYGMKSYVLVILKTGTNNIGPGTQRDSFLQVI